MMDRRKFTRNVAWSSLGFYFVKIPIVSATQIIDYPFKTLCEAFRSIQFDPAVKSNSFFVVTADVHYGTKGTDGMMAIINEINGMEPLPAFFCVDGDMICSGSSSFGVIPSEEGRETAINEFKTFKRDADLLNPKVRLILTIGNHDTHVKEIDPEIFWEVFPGYPSYQSFNLSGVHMIVLNGHSSGYIDSKQMEWLLNDVNKIMKDQEVVIFIHQPSMSHRVNERGIPAAISKVFENHYGKIWLIGGHEHLNGQKLFQLGRTKLTEHIITTGTANMWGDPEKPGYWVYCISNGKVIGRIFKRRNQGFRIENEPDLKSIEKVPMPFDHLQNIVWKVFVGDGDREFLVNSQARDCLDFWAYVKELIYRIPLKENGSRCTKIAMLCNYAKMSNPYQNDQYFLSSDMTHWKEINLENAKYETLCFLIPEDFLEDKTLYFKFNPSGEAHVGGFALLR